MKNIGTLKQPLLKKTELEQPKIVANINDPIVLIANLAKQINQAQNLQNLYQILMQNQNYILEQYLEGYNEEFAKNLCKNLNELYYSSHNIPKDPNAQYQQLPSIFKCKEAEINPQNRVQQVPKIQDKEELKNKLEQMKQAYQSVLNQKVTTSTFESKMNPNFAQQQGKYNPF